MPLILSFLLLREWVIESTGFLGRLFQTRLYHLHPCRRARAGMTM